VSRDIRVRVDVCVGVKCRYGARCDRGRCVCPSDCPDPDPAVSVCGSNGRTYPSACALRRDACKNDAEITVVDDGACVDAGSGSGGKTTFTQLLSLSSSAAAASAS